MLKDIVLFLKQRDFDLSHQTRDGRVNSAFNEDEILDILESKFDIERSSARDWFDFSFEKDEVFYPVNLKVSTLKTVDNLNCKLGIYYALTGDKPNFNNGISWDEYFKNLSEDLKENLQDYYFLIVNKCNTNDVFYTSLKRLNKITPNGNNLPFQARWDENRELIQRNFSESKDFILKYFEESLKLRADAYLNFKRYFNA